MYDHLTIIQKVVLALYAAISLHAFFYSWWHRRRITVGNVETTIIPLSLIVLLTAKLRFPYGDNIYIVVIGIVLYLAGEILIRKGSSHLGWINRDDFWFGRHEQKQRTLVTTGPYAHIRHPICVGLILVYLGLVLIFFHPIVLLVFVIGVSFSIYTEFKEEKFMLSKFPQYPDYMKRTGMFIPQISRNYLILALLFVGVIVLHFVANATGLYEMRIVWFDNVLHFLTGIAFGLTWLWIFRGSLKGSLAFVAILAVLWELLEFGFLKLFPIYAHSLSIFSPNINEALADIFSNVLGVIVLLMFLKLKPQSDGKISN